MGLTLTIENQTSLPDGGPLSVRVTGTRGLDIGRAQYLDWTLPDSTRHVSGKHCEVRYQDGAYLLFDTSTNGTFLYGSEHRIQSPYRLRHGDRLTIGPYIVAVALDDPGVSAPPAELAAAPRSYNEMWGGEGEAPPPIDPRDLKPVRPASGGYGDFLDRPVEAPEPFVPSPASRSFTPAPPPSAFDWSAPAPSAPQPVSDYDWAPQAPKPVEAEPPPPPAPTPRRQTPVAEANPWNAPSAAPAGEPQAVSRDAEPAAVEEAAPAAARPEPPAAEQRAAEQPVTEQPATEQPWEPAVEAAVPAADARAFVRRFAAAAGIPPEVLGHMPPEELATLLGSLMQQVSEQLKQLLNARGEAKRLSRSANQTMIQALENNPLKFSPTAEDALKIMLGPPTRSYLDARRTFEQSFADLRRHQLLTYSAMQEAVHRLVADLAPAKIEADTPGEGGLAALVASRKARLWDTYNTRWKAMADKHDNGLVDVFMLYFADAYDQSPGGRS